ncbi:MAG: hypothetical protein HY039_08520 [Nitrospirae bacterium]|nr:hypothetical protein [Nitrospirota bacterium]
MRLSPESEREFVELAASQSFRRDMETVAAGRHNPFLKDGRVDVDAYIEFVTQFNEFINHARAPFRPIQDRFMVL